MGSWVLECSKVQGYNESIFLFLFLLGNYFLKGLWRVLYIRVWEVLYNDI